MSNQKYQNLAGLMDGCSRAEQYFSKLPSYIQETIRQRGDHIHSEQELHDYAENLLRNE
ncbi:MAG TPA: hypothetical protein H9671_08200 [Firmicutes bacterium]|nr:hypothetical protein [Bacillota bacterium]